MDSIAAAPHSATLRMKARDWFSTHLPRHVLSRIPGVECRLSGSEKRIALTFDDGPHPIGTPRLLEILRQFDVHATFFLIGERARRWPELVREMLESGHEIGNHSWSHFNAWKATRADVQREFKTCQQALEELSGKPVPILRPPYGFLTPAVLRWARLHKIRPVLWDVIPPDYSQDRDLSRVSRIYHRYLRPGSIVCLHDNDVSLSVTSDLLKEAIPAAQQNGWRFTLLEETSERSTGDPV